MALLKWWHAQPYKCLFISATPLISLLQFRIIIHNPHFSNEDLAILANFAKILSST